MVFYLLGVFPTTHNLNLIVKTIRQILVKAVYKISEQYLSTVKFI